MLSNLSITWWLRFYSYILSFMLPTCMVQYDVSFKRVSLTMACTCYVFITIIIIIMSRSFSCSHQSSLSDLYIHNLWLIVDIQGYPVTVIPWQTPITWGEFTANMRFFFFFKNSTCRSKLQREGGRPNTNFLTGIWLHTFICFGHNTVCCTFTFQPPV